MRLHALLLVVAVLVAEGHGSSGSGISGTPQLSGPSVHGLQIGIALATRGTEPQAAAEFFVSFENVGDSDFVINVGNMLANGKVMLPTAVQLILTDPQGQTKHLRFFDRRYPAVAGRMDDFTVALRARSVYTLRLSLNQFWSPATKEVEVRLADGRHQIAALFEGQGATTTNLDMQGVALLNFWRGTVQSNVVEFEVPGRSAKGQH